MMNNINKILLFLMITIILSSCGYKIVNKDQVNNYSFNEINTVGDKRINYKIKNRLLFNSSKNSVNSFSLNINTKKNKSIKNKNIKNEILSYNLQIIAEINFRLLGETINRQFKISESGSYKASSQSLVTLNNEKQLLDQLTDRIINKIKYNLNSMVNDS